MSNMRKIVSGVLFILVAGGCSLNTTKVNVTHEPFDHVVSKRDGIILVKPFIDKRYNAQFIGTKRNGFGVPISNICMKDGVNIETLMTAYFLEALKETGYAIQSDNTKVKTDAIVEVEISDFWLDVYFTVRHRIGLKVKVIDTLNQRVIWENYIEDKQSTKPHSETEKEFWFGIASSEYEQIISQAVTNVFNKVVAEFTSGEFYKSFKKERIYGEWERRN